MPCLIETPMTSDIKQSTRQKTNNKISKNKNFTAKTENLNLKAHSNKIQSDKTLTTQTYFLLTVDGMFS